MSEKYPIIYITGKLNEVFPIVINVTIQVSSAGKMLPWSRDIFIYSLKCFRHNNYEIKFSWIRKLAGNNCLVYSGDFIQRVSFSHSGYVIIYRANDTWEIAKWSNVLTFIRFWLIQDTSYRQSYRIFKKNYFRLFPTGHVAKERFNKMWCGNLCMC